jgi:hypothetical protein
MIWDLSLCPMEKGGLDVTSALQALGVAVDIGPEGVARCIQECGVGFMFAPRCGLAYPRTHTHIRSRTAYIKLISWCNKKVTRSIPKQTV